MTLEQQYKGAKVVLLVVPEHTTTKKGWLERFKYQVPNFNNRIFRVITPKSNIIQRVRKTNSYYDNIFFVNHPLKNSEHTYKEILREIKNATIAVNGCHLFRHRKRLHVFPTEFNDWENKVDKYLLHRNA